MGFPDGITDPGKPREESARSLAQFGDGPNAISDHLRLRIISGELEAGEELKIQRLAGEYGVSIMPVREALRTLAAEGFIEIRPRRSPMVARLDFEEFLQVNEIRLALEPRVLEDAIWRHTTASLEQCRAIIEEDRNCRNRWKKVELNRRFHTAILEPSPKRRLKRLVAAQYGAIALCAQFLVVQSTVMIGERHAEHGRILKAIEDRNTPIALDCLSEHLCLSSERAHQALDQNRKWKS